MPELPDVSYFQDYVNHTAFRKRIVRVTCGDSSLLKDCNCAFLGRALHNKVIGGAFRRGKFLIIDIEHDSYHIVLHFGMTGYISYGKTDNRSAEIKEHGHLILLFENGYELRWVSIRKFGSVHFVRDPEDVGLIRDMGPEPLEMKEAVFMERLDAHSDKNIKSFLIDQRDIAGIGNEYADEILFRAGIDPHLRIKGLSDRRRSRMYTTMRETLTAAIAAKPPKNGLGEDWLAAHQEDMECPKNASHQLKKADIVSRSTLWCPQHQS